LRREYVQKSTRKNHGDSPVLLWKVANISGHDVVGLRLHRALQNFMVVGISRNSDSIAGSDQNAWRTKTAKRLGHFLGVELEFCSEQNFGEFFEKFCREKKH